MKPCTKCGMSKPLDDFYKHPKATDGRASKCKSCAKRDVRINYRANKAHYQEYERARASTPKRKALAMAIRKRDPLRYKARTAVANAVRDRRLVVQPCEVCGSAEVQAHHEDYAKPLDVMWLCFEHHRARHGQEAKATAGVRSFVVRHKEAA